MGKTLKLQFDPDKAGHTSVRKDISALAVAGRTLFCASDETADIERLVLIQIPVILVNIRKSFWLIISTCPLALTRWTSKVWRWTKTGYG